MTNQKSKILGFVTNLIFTTRIDSIISRVGYQFDSVDHGYPENQITEFVYDKDPGLILIDLDVLTSSWKSLISTLKSNPNTKGIPVICFGSHNDVVPFKEARQAGAEKVLARSGFFSSLPDIIDKYFLAA